MISPLAYAAGLVPFLHEKAMWELALHFSVVSDKNDPVEAPREGSQMFGHRRYAIGIERAKSLIYDHCAPAPGRTGNEALVSSRSLRRAMK